MSKGTVITFYSYKGGVGRTFALANIGALLSTWGYKTLCVDWDLEAPGLQFYFQPWIKEKDRPGLVEFIQAHVNYEKPRWQDYITEVNLSPTGTQLSFMKAGQQNHTYVQRLQAIDWATLYIDSKHNLGYFLEQLRADWKQAFDFVLIDSRTGITDISNICTVQLPDLLVLLLTANNQNLSGSLDTIKRLRAAHEELPFDRGNALIMPIISRFERRVEYERAEVWLDTFVKDLGQYYNEWIHRDTKVRDILNFTRIPSIPFWSFGEGLPVIEKGTGETEDIGYPLETLAALVAQRFSFTDVLLQNRDSFVMAAKKGAKERDREDTTSTPSTLGTAPDALTQVFISYAPEDEQFKKTLDRHLSTLRRQGVINTWSDREIPAGVERGSEINARLEAANVILLLISSDYLVSPASDSEMARALQRAQAGEARIIPIILRPVDWQASLISTIQVLPYNGQPVTVWKDQDAAWANVAKGIREAVESLKKS